MDRIYSEGYEDGVGDGKANMKRSLQTEIDRLKIQLKLTEDVVKDAERLAELRKLYITALEDVVETGGKLASLVLTKSHISSGLRSQAEWYLASMPLAKLEGRAARKDEPELDGCLCQRCNNKYKVDFVISNSLWEQIKPINKPRGSGLLCGKCIINRIEGLNIYKSLIVYIQESSPVLSPSSYMEVPLTQGKVALVDTEDYDKVIVRNWFAKKERYVYYAISKERKSTGETKPARMHRFIMNPPDDMEVDHINGDGLDNRKVNLRICTRKQNAQNTRLPKNNTSGYRGVTRNKRHQKWLASIRIDGKSFHIGLFDDKKDAAKAYDKKAKELHGDFATLNFPASPQPDIATLEAGLPERINRNVIFGLDSGQPCETCGAIGGGGKVYQEPCMALDSTPVIDCVPNVGRGAINKCHQ